MLAPRRVAVLYCAPLRILGIETSSVRGSVALIETGRTLAVASHQRENAHEQSIQPLIEQVLAEAGWSARTLDRVAVGTGPGSFTGLRVGIALAQGISEGLEISLVGVPSLEAMARAAPEHLPGPRVAVLDARRGELFLAAYDVDGLELLAPQIVEGVAAAERLAGTLPGPALMLGQVWSPIGSERPHHRSEDCDLPHARWTALLAAAREPSSSVVPLYLRPPTAVVPPLKPNPLAPDLRG
ncbi:MAG: tRNA ((37)-N6)-threonylcarbamoyltransferase complex dimerization subunit type 1 TsaB [Pseudomonadota bacterium]|jgi:tRNA threonylcarbamoyladenosine biosynthesis protein TsaB